MERLKQIKDIVMDRQNVTLLCFGFIVLGVTWATIREIEFNYQLERQLRVAEEEVAILELQVQAQQLQNDFLATDYFQELSARDQLGLVEEGETLVVLGSERIGDRTAAIEAKYRDIEPTITEDDPSPIEQWVRFFKGSQPL